MSLFSARLKKLRKEQNLTQKQLALNIGASERGIQQYELGERKPTYDMLCSLAEYFNVPTDYLTGRGLFSDWDDIMLFKDGILDAIKAAFDDDEAIVKILDTSDNYALMRVLPAFVDSVKVDYRKKHIQIYLFEEQEPRSIDMVGKKADK